MGLGALTNLPPAGPQTLMGPKGWLRAKFLAALRLIDPTVWAALAICLKLLVFFGFLVLVRLSTPRPRLESMSRAGWLTGLALLAYIFVVYGVFFIAW